MSANPRTTNVSTVNNPVCALWVIPATKAYLRNVSESGMMRLSGRSAVHGGAEDAAQVADTRRETITARRGG